MTDEAPALATVSLLPILQAFSKSSGVKFESRDISLSSRILATFNDFLGSKIKYENDLEFLGKLVKDPNANIIKLPNISASIPQLKKAITELQSQGYNIPNYPEKVENDNDLIIKSIYDKIKGSAVNPVLREGNSDRRVPKAIKNYIKSNFCKKRRGFQRLSLELLVLTCKTQISLPIKIKRHTKNTLKKYKKF